MATKKQKRAALEAKRLEREEALRLEGLAAQRADQERRAKTQQTEKIRRANELAAQHERDKQARKDISDAQREHQEFLDNATPGQILRRYAMFGAVINEFAQMHTGDNTPIDLTRYPQNP